jgi:hypothetical protein
LHERRNNTLEPLTEREQVMLALLGDGTTTSRPANVSVYRRIPLANRLKADLEKPGSSAVRPCTDRGGDGNGMSHVTVRQ